MVHIIDVLVNCLKLYSDSEMCYQLIKVVTLVPYRLISVCLSFIDRVPHDLLLVVKDDLSIIIGPALHAYLMLTMQDGNKTFMYTYLR